MTLTTEDGVTIAGLYRHAEGAHAAVLLLHMMPATKESWDDFAEELAAKGISSLAIDLRGHGESLMQGGEKLNYREFEDEEHQAYRIDVEAAADWLKKKEGMTDERFAVIGASIGSNLALRYAYEHPEVRGAIALSPGVDYHGVLTRDAVGGAAAHQKLLIAVSGEDELSHLSVKKLEEIDAEAEVKYVHLENAGHGTTMFEKNPAFMRDALDWIVGLFS